MIDIQKVTAGLQNYLTRAFAPINKRSNDLEARIAALERSVAAFEYKGTWRDGPTYVRNNSATHNGSLWIVRAEQTTQRPGDGSDWQLAVKKGRDAA